RRQEDRRSEEGDKANRGSNFTVAERIRKGEYVRQNAKRGERERGDPLFGSQTDKIRPRLANTPGNSRDNNHQQVNPGRAIHELCGAPDNRGNYLPDLDNTLREQGVEE